jgi:hypothetical protein
VIVVTIVVVVAAVVVYLEVAGRNCGRQCCGENKIGNSHQNLLMRSSPLLSLRIHRSAFRERFRLKFERVGTSTRGADRILCAIACEFSASVRELTPNQKIFRAIEELFLTGSGRLGLARVVARCGNDATVQKPD